MRWGQLRFRGAVHLISRLAATAFPHRGSRLVRTDQELPRKKEKSIKISSAPSIDGSRSKATSYKSDTPVSGGAYQDARKVTIVWNDV